MGCGVYWQQINELDRALGALQRAGLGPGFAPYNALVGLRGKVFGQLGIKYPRTITQLIRLLALSPGEISVWHDIESGWMVKAIESPGVPPVYRYVSDDVAITILSGGLTHELEAELFKPDDYIGE